jgi:hypothetical protein
VDVWALCPSHTTRALLLVVCECGKHLLNSLLPLSHPIPRVYDLAPLADTISSFYYPITMEYQHLFKSQRQFVSDSELIS